MAINKKNSLRLMAQPWVPSKSHTAQGSNKGPGTPPGAKPIGTKKPKPQEPRSGMSPEWIPNAELLYESLDCVIHSRNLYNENNTGLYSIMVLGIILEGGGDFQ